MNYDTLMIEMFMRIQALEAQIKEMREITNRLSDDLNKMKSRAAGEKVTTEMIRRYIEQMKRDAASAEETCLVIRASDIHKKMQLKSRFPMVCNAMRQCMTERDEVVHDTPSGYSSTLEISYFLR